MPLILQLIKTLEELLISDKECVMEKKKKIYLPPEDFAYGLPNRPPTPFKDVIYNAYGNRAEDVIRNEYDCYIRERSVRNSRPPKVVPRYINPKVEELRKKEMDRRAGSLDYEPMVSPYDEVYQTKKDDKPLYKLKMFQDVGSKVAEEIKLFKTYHPYKKKKKNEDGVDYLINKVQGEIQQNQNLNQYPPNNYAPQNQPQENYQQQYVPPQGNYQQQPIPQ